MTVDRAGMKWQVMSFKQQDIRPAVSVSTTDGRIYINAAALAKLGDAHSVIALYSAEHSSIGLAPCGPENPHAMGIYRRPRSGDSEGGVVGSIALARQLVQLGFTGTVRLPANWHPDGVLWCDLESAQKTPGRKRRARA